MYHLHEPKPVYGILGAVERHSLLAGNAFALLWLQLRGGHGKVFYGDMPVGISETKAILRPDVVALIEIAEYEDERREVLLNPSVLFDALSPSTEMWDRTGKFAHYRRLPTLREYLLIAQDQMRVEVYACRGEQWLFTELSRPDDVLRLESVGCDLTLADIYERVDFHQNPPLAPNGPAPHAPRWAGLPRSSSGGRQPESLAGTWKRVIAWRSSIRHQCDNRIDPIGRTVR